MVKKISNFYTDGRPEEVREAVVRLTEFVRAAEAVRAKFFSDDGHPVLEGIEKIAQKLAASEASTPLSVLCVGVELLLRRLDEWNRHFATREAKLTKQQHRLAALSARWRSMELASWPHLLETRIRTVADLSANWFPHMFEVVNRAKYDAVETSKETEGDSGVLAVLDQFLRSSSVGEFDSRIELVACFSSFLLNSLEADGNAESNPAMVRLANSLASLAGFYRQLVEPAVEMINEVRVPLESRMKEFAKLAQWKGTEIGSATVTDKDIRDKDLEFFRLKAAADNNRRKLHGICVTMDAALRAPVSEVESKLAIKYGLSELKQGAKASSKPNAPLFELVPHIAASVEEDDGVEMEDGRLGRIVELERKVKSLSAIWIQQSLVRRGLNTSVAIEQAGRVRALELVQLEPTKELVSVKKRALTDLLRALASSGLSSHESQVRIRSSIAWLATKPTPIERADEEFYRCVLRQKKLVEVSGSAINSDVTRREARLMVAYCQHLFSLLAEDRDAIGSVTQASIRLNALVRELLSWSRASSMSSSIVSKVCEAARRLKETSCEAQLVSEALSAASKLDTIRPQDDLEVDAELVRGRKKVAEELAQFAAALEQGLKDVDLEELKKRRGFRLVGMETERMVQQASSVIGSATISAKSRVKSSVCAPFVDAAQSAVEFASAALYAEHAKKSVEESSPVDEFRSAAAHCIDIVLIATQNLHHKLGVPKRNSEDEDEHNHGLMYEKSLRRAHEATVAVEDHLRVNGVRAAAEKLIALGNRISKHDSRECCSLAHRVGTLLQTFQDQVLQEIVRDSLRLYEQGCALLRCMQCIFITVCEKGFCRPQETGEGEGKPFHFYTIISVVILVSPIFRVSHT